MHLSIYSNGVDNVLGMEMEDRDLFPQEYMLKSMSSDLSSNIFNSN